MHTIWQKPQVVTSGLGYRKTVASLLSVIVLGVRPLTPLSSLLFALKEVLCFEGP